MRVLKVAGITRFIGLILSTVILAGASARAADPIKIGFSMALTGAVAPNGKQLLAMFEIWRDDVNARGGLLGRPVQLVYYDDQSNPANVPPIYTKLVTVDKVDILAGPYNTNNIASAMPVIIQNKKMLVSLLGLSVNKKFNYPRYFSTTPLGPDGPPAFSKGFFELAAAQNPRPRSVALVSVDNEFGKNVAEGARNNARAAGFKIVYDERYPPTMTDLTPVMRVVQTAAPDMVFATTFPPDTIGLLRAASEIGLAPKMFGGAMIGLYATPIKMQLGPLLNGIVNNVPFMPQLNFTGSAAMLAKYQAKAPALGIDPLGYAIAPYAYAAGQLIAAAVEGTGSLDDDKLATYLHSHPVDTVVGPIAYGTDGEWIRSGVFFTQYQNVTGNDLGQFKNAAKEIVLWPDKFRAGNLIYPYTEARKFTAR